MGLILDSSLLIAGERRGQRVWDILERAKASQGETENALSVITVVELTHGIYRAKSEADRQQRRVFGAKATRPPKSFPRLRAHWQEWQQALLREAADYRKASCDHKSMWVIRNVTRLLTEIAALERAFGLDR